VILRHHAPRRGLTLLEVLLSLTILVLALTAIGRLVDMGTDHGNQARAYNRGARLAQSKMAEVEAGILPVSSNAEGQFEGDDATWSYSVTSEAAGPPNLYTVSVKVSSDVKGQPVQVVVTQMIFDPSMTGSAAQAERPAASDGSGDPSSSGSGTASSGMGGTSP
jgi:prepilin-type N-terminal cleavage/methylation domain-containing protein